MSAYDLLPEDEREAIAWVREHGGIESVKAQRRESMPRAAYERKKAGFLDHIAECETALGRRNHRIEELGRRVGDLTRENAELRRRAMPEGCEWPRYESGELVQIGDDVTKYVGGGTIKVRSVEFLENRTYLHERFNTDQIAIVRPGERVRRPAVLAGDGEPLEVGQTVWDVESGEELKVEKLCNVGLVQLLTRDGVSRYVYPDQLTHTKPEIDTWQRIEEDALLPANDYRERHGMEKRDGVTWQQQIREDLVQRCRALAERERGE